MTQPEPEPEQEAQPEIGSISAPTSDDEVWGWLVAGELKLPEILQCSGSGGTRMADAQWVIAAAQGSQYYYTFDSYVKPGSPLDTPANRQTFNRNQRSLQDALIRYARDPQSGECAVVNAYTQWYQFTRSLHIAGYTIGIKQNTPEELEELSPELQAQWDQYMHEFDRIMEGVLDPSTVKDQLEDWYGRLIHSEAYLAMFPAPGQVPTVGSRPDTGTGRLTYGFTLSGLAPSFEAAQTAMNQTSQVKQNQGFTITTSGVMQVK